jgi:predicted transposase YbfD/YdcC
MQPLPHTSFLAFFDEIDDPRIDRTKRHDLVDILFLCVCAVLCGADDCVAIADFAKGREDWLRQFVPFDGGAPSHDTISRVLSLLDPKQFTECFIRWVAAIQEKTDGQIIAIDGKSVRRSFDTASGKAAIHMVSAWGSKNSLALGQVKTDDKSNEITAIPKLLQMLDIRGCTITLDAMGTQRAIARQITEQGGYYVMALKRNQSDLFGDVETFFDRAQKNRFMDLQADPISHDTYQTVDANHGRIETRRCWCTDRLEDIITASAWTGLRSIALIESERRHNGQTSTERRFYISSLPADARTLLGAIRTHWGIENSLHWVLDVTFQEDQMRTRKDNGPELRAMLNHVAVNICKTNTTRKASIRRKRNMAAWEPDFLTELITNQVKN